MSFENVKVINHYKGELEDLLLYKNLEKLYVSDIYDLSILSELDNLRELVLNYQTEIENEIKIPSNVKKLSISSNKNSYLEKDVLCNLCEGLEELELCYGYRIELKRLPLSLRKLCITSKYLKHYLLEDLLSILPLFCDLYIDGREYNGSYY